eukprot:664297-Prymnesium_polylepis.1
MKREALSNKQPPAWGSRKGVLKGARVQVDPATFNVQRTPALIGAVVHQRGAPNCHVGVAPDIQCAAVACAAPSNDTLDNSQTC